MTPEWFGILLLGVLFVAIFIGFPIAFTLIAVAAIGGYAMLGPLALHLMTLQVFSVMRDPTLASVPFFLFMGFLLEQSGLMERLVPRRPARVRVGARLAVSRGAGDGDDLRRGDGHRRLVGDAARRDGGAGDEALGLRHPPLGRRDRRGRHARHPDPAVGHADRDGARGRRARDGPLRRRRHSRDWCWRCSTSSTRSCGAISIPRWDPRCRWRSAPNRSARSCASSCSASRRSSSSSSRRSA